MLNIDIKTRNKRIRQLHREGHTLKYIAAKYYISSTHVRRILYRKVAIKDRKTLDAHDKKNPKAARERKRRWASKNKAYLTDYKRYTYQNPDEYRYKIYQAEYKKNFSESKRRRKRKISNSSRA